MITQQVRIGADTITVQAPTLEELVVTVSDYRLMHYRLNGVADATLRFRKNDGGEFMEFVSRKLKAVKPVSKEKDSRDIYIGRTTPWVRYEKESGDTYVRFDGLSEELEAVGWTEDDIGTFVKAERYTPKGGMRVWSYKPIRD